jgi:molecular chaperone GrpE (heat shock protein)
MTTHGGKRPGAGRKAGPTASANERFTEARAQKEAALARLRQAEADERERLLIPASEVEETVGTAFATIAQRLLSLPDELERLHDLEPALAESIEGTIHQVMTSLADDLQTLAGDLQP